MTSVVSRETTHPFRRTLEKPWGSEDIFTEATLPYTGKVLRVRAGCRLSLQLHDGKTETLMLVSGEAQLVLESPIGELETFSMEHGRGYTVLPGTRHRLCGVSDALVFEVSTPERGTTLRLEDDYGRTDEVWPNEEATRR